MALLRRRSASLLSWAGSGVGGGASPFQEGWILGRHAPLSSDSALLPKGVLPLFLSFFLNYSLPPPPRTHTPGKGQGRVLRGCRSPGPLAVKSGTNWRVPSQALHPLALQGQRQARIPSWASHPTLYSPARQREPWGSQARPCILQPAALRVRDRHETPRLDPASCPAAQALGPSSRNPVARIPSLRGGGGGRVQIKHGEGLANMALLKMEPRLPERPDLGCCLGLLALPLVLSLPPPGRSCWHPPPGGPWTVLILSSLPAPPSFSSLSVPLSPFCVCGWRVLLCSSPSAHTGRVCVCGLCGFVCGREGASWCKPRQPGAVVASR